MHITISHPLITHCFPVNTKGFPLVYPFLLLLSAPKHITHNTVTNLSAVNTTTNSTTITWDQPPHNYRVFLHGEATDNIPQSRVIHLVNVTGQTTHNIGGLNSFRNYSIGVYLESDLGQGSNATVRGLYLSYHMLLWLLKCPPFGRSRIWPKNTMS